MSLIFITGVSGVGKTMVTHELINRHYEAYDTDKNGFSEWRNKLTNKPVDESLNLKYGTPKWFDTYLWTLLPDKVNNLKNNAKTSHIFLCGAPGNAIEISKLFDKVICLTISDTELTHHVSLREARYDNELQDVIKWNRSFERSFRQENAIIINASGSPRDIANIILN